MKNIYAQGRRKEYKIVNKFKKAGFDIVQRTAGSHSPIDIIAIKRRTKEIYFIQSKGKSIKEREVNRILRELDYLNGLFNCKVIVV